MAHGKDMHLPTSNSDPEVKGQAPLDSAPDPLVDAFKKDVDRTLLIENLRRTVDERARRMNEFIRALERIRGILRTRAS
jgi:hypothetical protein